MDQRNGTKRVPKNKLTRQHFELIAGAMAEARAAIFTHTDVDPTPEQVVLATLVMDCMVDHVTQALRATNPAFDVDKFRQSSRYAQMPLPIAPTITPCRPLSAAVRGLVGLSGLTPVDPHEDVPSFMDDNPMPPLPRRMEPIDT